MTIAAAQLREYLEAKYPGVRISRKACRDTAGGSVSQHSAFDGYDSNALDIMGGSTSGTAWTRSENIALIELIVADILTHRDEWSIRLVLWKVPDHFGHAHVDFWPTILVHKWCGGPDDPTWALSNGDTITTRDPEPENGPYEGKATMTYSDWANGLFDLLNDDEIQDLFDAGYIEGDPAIVVAYWANLRDLGSEGRTPSQRKEVARFVQTSQVSAWLHAAN